MSEKESTNVPEIKKIIDESQVESDTALMLNNSFSPFLTQVTQFEKDVFSIVVSDESQVEEMQKARELRLRLKNLRIGAEKTRKTLKEDSLRYGKAVQGLYNLIEYKIVPLEKHLEDQENFIKKQKEKALEELRIKRESALAPYEEFIPSALNLAAITESDFERILAGAKVQQQMKKDAEQKAEEERLKREKEEKEEQERIRLENIKLKAEAEERDRLAKIESDKLEKERLEREKKEQSEREEREKKERAEKEKQAKERAEAEKKIAAEKAEREKAEKALKEKEAEELRIKKEAEERDRKASLAPDKEKILAFAKMIDSLVLPEIKNAEANQVIIEAKEQLNKVSIFLLKKADLF